MSIQNLLTDNKFIIYSRLASLTGAAKGSMLVSDGEEYKPITPNEKFQILTSDPEEPTGVKWVNRSYCCNITTKNNTLASGNNGVGIPAKIITNAMTLQNNLGGGYQLGPGDNEVFTNDLFSSFSGTPLHRVLISFVVRKASAFGPNPVNLDFYLVDVITGVITTTSTKIVVTDVEQIVTINSIINVPPNNTLSLFYTNLSDGAGIVVKQVDWYMEFMGSN